MKNYTNYSCHQISRITIYIFLITYLFTSCQTNKLIEKNNSITDESVLNLKTLNTRTLKIEELIRDNSDTLLRQISSPNLKGLSQLNYSDFYSGNILEESVTIINATWSKIELTQSIPSGGNSFIIEKTGYFNTNTPSVIYYYGKKIATSKIDYLNEKIISEFLTTDKKIIDTLLRIKSNTARTDQYTQKEVDIMLANNQYCFDGFRFDNKRFDYIDLNKGSFRGTKFNGCVLDYAISKRSGFNNNSFDFDNTAITNSTQSNWNLDYWKMFNCYFIDTKINFSYFNNSNFEKSNFTKTTFTNCRFKNQNEIAFNEISSVQLIFNGCYFDSVRVFSSNIWAGSFINSTFHNSQFKWSNFSTYGNIPTKIETSGFYNCEFISGSFDGTIIEHPASHSIFDNVKFINPLWRNCKIKAWFRGNSSFLGYGSYMNGTNWSSSIFENTTFNAPLAPKLLPLQNCDFSKAEFRENVVFQKCDLTGTIFPPNEVLLAAGVKFFNCKNAPYDS